MAIFPLSAAYQPPTDNEPGVLVLKFAVPTPPSRKAAATELLRDEIAKLTRNTTTPVDKSLMGQAVRRARRTADAIQRLAMSRITTATAAQLDGLVSSLAADSWLCGTEPPKLADLMPMQASTEPPAEAAA